MTTRIKLRRDLAANWTATNPTLAAGEPGLETDTGKIKYGTGSAVWTALAYAGGGSDSLTSENSIQVQTGDADRWLVRLRREDASEQPDPFAGVVVYSTNYDSQGNAIVLAKINLTESTVAAFKFTAAGELVWKTIVDPQGMFVSEGHAAITPTDDVVFCLDNDSDSVLIVKLSGTTGAVTVSQQIEIDVFTINSIAVDNTGSIIIAGLDEIDNNVERGLIMKLSSNAATIVWQTALTMPNDDYVALSAVAVDFLNNIVVTGVVPLATPDGVNQTEEVIVVAKFASTTGDIIWQKTVALPETRFGAGVGLSLDSLGNIFVTGALLVDNPNADTFGSSLRSNAAVVFKMSTAGTILWDRRIGPGPCDWVGVSTAVGADGDLYLYAATYQYRANAEVENDRGFYDQTLVLARYQRTTGAVVWQSYFNNPNAQEVPGTNFGPWGGGATDTMDVFEDRILVGGAVRLGPSDIDTFANQETNRYFSQGFVAQFDTAATKFAVDGWTLETSRVPGKLTNTLIATVGTMTASTPTYAVGTTLGIPTLTSGISVSRRTSKTNTWTFGKDGTFLAPADTNIKLQQTQLGYANMYGIWGNNSDGIWFDCVTHDADGFAYAAGSNEWNDGFAHIYKFAPTGELVWQRQLFSGSGAEFDVIWLDGVYTEVTVRGGGSDYKVGDRIVLNGSDLSGVGGVNSLTLTVATLSFGNSEIGPIASVTIDSGVAVGSGSATAVRDFYDNAECEVSTITFDPITQNPIVVISTPTYNGDTQDSEWTETVILQIDSGSGAVINTTTLSGNGDIYPEDVAISVTGQMAVVGQKYGEYTEYGEITPLAGSGVDVLVVTKADIDAEHFPGEEAGNISDWWITGSSITDQTRVNSVNQYPTLTGTTRQGSGAAFNITNNGDGTYSVAVDDQGNNYLAGHTIRVVGTDLTGDEILTTYTEGVDYASLEVTRGATDTIRVVSTQTAIIALLNTGTILTNIDNLGETLTITGPGVEDEGVLVYPTTGTVTVPQGTTIGQFTLGGTYATGATPDNDCVITIISNDVENGMIVSHTGLAAGTRVATAGVVSGTNIDVGSGAEFYVEFNATTGVAQTYYKVNNGSNYVVGDVITIAGTNFAAGVAPTHDVVVTIQNPSIQADSFESNGVPTTHLLLRTNASVNFVDEATFEIKQNLDGETFIWTPTWNKTIGGSTTDAFYGVVWNAAGTSVYAVGEGRYETDYDQALVTKWTSTGTLQASVSINANQDDNGAEYGAVALMADDSIVTVHTMYNSVRDETTEVLVTKLDSDLNIVWQQFIGIWSNEDGWESPQGQPSVAVDPATDEILVVWEADADDTISDRGIHIVKLDTDGDVIWKRVFGVHESDTELRNGAKFVSISGDKYTVVGTTDAPSDDTNNAMIFTMPLDGTGMGYHGIWWYFEPNDDQVKVMRVDRTSEAFTPYTNSNIITATDNAKYYFTGYPDEEFDLFTQVVRSEVGGAVEFADGSRQSFSTAVIPQVQISAGRYVIRPEDSGRHILVESADYSIRIPNYREVALPVGFTFTIVNISGSDIFVSNQSPNNGNQGQMWFSGGDDRTPFVGIRDNGSGQMVTLIKIKEGNSSDDGDNRGDIWMIAGADIYNDD